MRVTAAGKSTKTRMATKFTALLLSGLEYRWTKIAAPHYFISSALDPRLASLRFMPEKEDRAKIKELLKREAREVAKDIVTDATSPNQSTAQPSGSDDFDFGDESDENDGAPVTDMAERG